MVRFEINKDELVGMERVSRRVQEAVEIFERETVRTIRMQNGPKTNALTAATKLVIDDALSATKIFIAKARSEANGLNSVLNEIIRGASRVR